MTLATRTVNGNNSGLYLRTPRIVVMHATRSGQVKFTDAQELGSTLNWFENPAGASSHWVLSETERVRVVEDTLIAWHSAYLNGRSWGVELTQPTIDRPFRDGHYANAALVGRHYVALGVAPVWLDYWDGNDASGFVSHEDTVQGRESGKSDPGPEFDRERFIASLEDDMALDPVKDKATFEKMLRSVLSRTEVIAIKDDGKTTGGYASLGLNIYRIRQNERHAKDAAKHGGGGYSDAQAVKAVKDKL